MIIVQDHVEERLIQALKSSKTSGWEPRCAHIDGRGGALMRAVDIAALAAKHAEGAQTQLFLCDDGDVFILSNDVPFKNYAALHEEILAKAPGVASRDATFMQVFDIRSQWFSIMEILEARNESRRERERQAREESEKAKRERQRERILDINFSDAVLKSIPQRRRGREKKFSLIVDDDFFTRALVTNVVGRATSFIPVGSGEEAIRSYVAEAPDIVFLDIGLPDVSGHEVLNKLLKIDPQAYIVMLSGGGNRENIMQAMSAGAKGFIVKPFTQEKIRQYIDKCSQDS